MTLTLAEEDWHMPIESFQYFIILFRVNQVFTFYHFIDLNMFKTMIWGALLVATSLLNTCIRTKYDRFCPKNWSNINIFQ